MLTHIRPCLVIASNCGHLAWYCPTTSPCPAVEGYKLRNKPYIFMQKVLGSTLASPFIKSSQVERAKKNPSGSNLERPILSFRKKVHHGVPALLQIYSFKEQLNEISIVQTPSWKCILLISDFCHLGSECLDSVLNFHQSLSPWMKNTLLIIL